MPCPYPQPPLWHVREAKDCEGIRAKPSAENVCEDVLSKLPKLPELNRECEDARLSPSDGGKADAEEVPDCPPEA